MPADIVLIINSKELTGSALKPIHRELRALAAPGRRLVLDLAGVERIDTRGAGLILDAARKLQSRGGSLKLVGIRKGVALFFEMLRMHRVLEMHGSQQDALAVGVAA